MIGDRYWATGITVGDESGSSGSHWWAKVRFYDDGFAEDGSTEGELRLRYVVPRAQLEEQVELLRADAERLGIEWRPIQGSPTVYAEDDDESLQQVANAIAKALGWQLAYAQQTDKESV